MELERFTKTILPLADKLRYLAMDMLRNGDDADDAVQETFLRLWKNRLDLDKHPNTQGFAVVTLKNICIDRIRKDKFDTSIDALEFSLSEEATPYKKAELKDSIAIVNKIIESLPELQRTILMMRDVEGYELSEIASITGTQVSAVTTNLSRARKRVRETFLRITEKRN